MKNVGIAEIGIVVLILILVIGGKKIAELIRGLAQGIREYRKASHEK